MYFVYTMYLSSTVSHYLTNVDVPLTLTWFVIPPFPIHSNTATCSGCCRCGAERWSAVVSQTQRYRSIYFGILRYSSNKASIVIPDDITWPNENPCSRFIWQYRYRTSASSFPVDTRFLMALSCDINCHFVADTLPLYMDFGLILC